MWIRWISDRFVSLMNRVAPLWGRPRVRTVTTVELARWLNHEPESVVLVDVRSDKEVLVSQIPGAITRREFNECRHDCRDKLVIAYCTVGGRRAVFSLGATLAAL
jgi:rhodanese-related sulfurtransferase